MTERTSDATQKVPRFVPDAPRQYSLQRIDKPSEPVVVGGGRCGLGSFESNEVRISDDPKVSRFHCEVGVDKGIAWVKDLGSSNGTYVDGLQVKEAYLKDGSMIRLGPETTVRFRLLEQRAEWQVAKAASFGPLTGKSIAM